MAEERGVADVVQDIFQNLQEMVRSEFRLAKVEVRDDLRQAVSSSTWLAAGVAAALSVWLFLLWTIAYGLATRMPMWAATSLVALLMACIAGALLMGGLRKAKRIQPMPERTVESVKENLEWIRQPMK